MTPYYQHGGITIYHGDCLEILPGFILINPTVITDPPYGIALKNNCRNGQTTKRRERDVAVTGDADKEVGQRLLDWCDYKEFPTIAFASPWSPWRGEWRNLIVWDKGGAVGGGGDIETCLKRTWELIQVARNEPMNGGRDGSVWSCPMLPQDSNEHICAKPLELMLRLVSRFTSPGRMIVDPFFGSGSTLRAAKDLGRRAIGIEIEEKYCEIAVRRLEQEVFDL